MVQRVYTYSLAAIALLLIAPMASAQTVDDEPDAIKKARAWFNFASEYIGEGAGVGPQGPQGEQGVQGPQGEQGTPGDIGPPGESFTVINTAYPNLLAGERRTIVDIGNDFEITRAVLTLTDNPEAGTDCSDLFDNEGVYVAFAPSGQDVQISNSIALTNTGIGDFINCNFIAELSISDPDWPLFAVQKVGLVNNNGGNSTPTDFPKVSLTIFINELP